MKNKILGILAIFTTLSLTTFAQFEGKVVYGMDYELPEAMESQKAMLPSEMSMFIGKDKTKVVQNTMMGVQIAITDLKTQQSTLLMDLMGQKMAIAIPAPTKEELAKEQIPTYKYDSKTKTLAGYKCKHAVMTMTDENGSTMDADVYYTEDIPAAANEKLKGLKGFPLEYTVLVQGMTMIVKAKTISQEKLDKSEFVKPEGFQDVTMEEFGKLMGM